MDFKDIHIGKLIYTRVTERNIDISRIINFFKLQESEILLMYNMKNISTDILLKWCKLLDYDFFRIYSHHLILFSPASSMYYEKTNQNESVLPKFRKNIYTKEIIDFILETIKDGKMSKTQIIERYKIPKTTLLKWIEKYDK